MDNTEDTMSQTSDSMKSNLSEDNIIIEFLTELCKLGKKKIWNHISSRMLYKYYLSDAEAINSSFIVAELDLLHEIIKKHTGKILFKASDNKSIKVNKISQVIGYQTILNIVKKKQHDIKSLKDLCYKIISSGSVPKAVLATSVAHIKCHL